ncbi:MAG: peptidoglycan DD-metalloendopeptidase family protein [Bacillota bacterium]|nr:peptidoglycan DD-metalloendopeptidase family protein [Bacillota bacterium]
MKKRKLSLISLTVFISVLLMVSFGIFADDIGDLKSSQDEINGKIDAAQEDLGDVKNEKSATMDELKAIEDSIASLAGEIDTLDNQLAEAEAQLVAQQKEYETIQENLGISQESMRERVRSIYVNGDVSYWDVLFSASTVQEFLSNFVFFEKITEKDHSIVTSIQENKRLAEEKLAELEQTKTTIASLKSDKEAQQARYNQQEEEKMAMVASLEADEASLNQMIAEMEAESSSIESEIQAYYAEQQRKAEEEAAKKKQEQEQPADDGNNDAPKDNSDDSNDGGDDYTGSGSMRWPLNIAGRDSSGYGYRGGEFHTGIDIAAPKGTPVLAADSGRVILVKRLNYSYGHYVVIDHGGSISTLYAHMSAIHVSVGQNVSKGQQIGEVGSTGRSSGNHLHFEVRINGKHTNPWGYVSR